MAAAVDFSARRYGMAESRGPYHTNDGTNAPSGPTPTRESAKIVPLTGAMLGIANDISEALARARMPGNHRAFLELVRRDSQGNAGYQREAGYENPGTSCLFDLAHWAIRLGWDRSYVRRVRDRLVTDRVIWFTPDDETPGRGQVGVNLRFEEWLPLDRQHTNALHARSGAGYPKGRPRKQEASMDNGIYAPGEHGQWDIPEASEHGQWEMKKQIPVSTVACLESGPEAARDDALRKVRRRGTEETDANASDAATSASVVPDLSVDDTSAVSAASEQSHTPTPTPSRRKARSDSPASVSGEGEAPPSSARPPHERSVGGKASKPGRVPKISPEEQAYCAGLCKAMVAVNGGQQPPNREQEWAGARRFFRLREGEAADPESVEACAREEIRRPKWDSTYLSLQSVFAVYGAYLRGPENFRRGIDRARQAANGEFGGEEQHHNGRTNRSGGRTTGAARPAVHSKEFWERRAAEVEARGY